MNNPAIDPHELAMTAAAMMLGAAPLLDMARQRTGFSLVDLTDMLVKQAEYCERRYMEIQQAEDFQGVPGVWQYDVCTPFGRMVMTHILSAQKDCTEEDSKRMFDALLAGFMQQW